LRVTWWLLSLVARLPNLSNSLTVTAGLMATPATVLLGWWAKARLAAAAALMVKLDRKSVVKGHGPVAGRGYEPAVFRTRLPKVATPPLAVAVPPEAMPPGPLADSVT